MFASSFAPVFGSALARTRPYLLTALLALLIFYFGVNALVGERGLLVRGRTDAALIVKTAELHRLHLEREALETQVRLLGDGGLSRDLLEERARVLLGFADPRDYVIRIPRRAD